ncbi:MAG: hypothetical protein ACRENZ_01435, partial [Thermodesulfobacteriota bacterium]
LIPMIIILILLVIPACKNKSDTEIQGETVSQIEENITDSADFKQSLEQLQAEVKDLHNKINGLIIEKQKLIAEKKRLEAEVIELRIGLTTPPPLQLDQ